MLGLVIVTTQGATHSIHEDVREYRDANNAVRRTEDKFQRFVVMDVREYRDASNAVRRQIPTFRCNGRELYQQTGHTCSGEPKAD